MASTSQLAEKPSEAEEEANDASSERAKKDQELSKAVMSSAAVLVRTSNGLPRLGEDYELLQSFGSFAALTAEQETRVITLISRVLASAGARTRLPRQQKDLGHFFDRIVEASDGIIERSGIVLDELDRARRDERVKVPRAVIDAESTRRTLATDDFKGRPDSQGFKIPLNLTELRRSAGAKERTSRVSLGTAKPQMTYGFAASICNTHEQFVPRLRVKHHALERRRQEGLVVREEDGERGQSSQWISDEAIEAHPYAYELNHWEPPTTQLESLPVKAVPEMDKTLFTMVDTKEALQKLVKVLNRTSEFAVDLEAHDHRSFAGLTCLMQISTRDEDFIVDPFPVWDDMHLLNEPFSDPSILKVFHGSDSDVLWLQRDFGIFVQNIFDTYRGMKREGTFAKFSLAALVQHYCGVNLQKEYQLADWRVRPLPDAQLEYARCDTHYLLHCYDRLRERLLETGNEHKNLLRAVYTDGVDLCKKLYENPPFNPEGYQALIGTRKSFNNRQLYALAELWKWRDVTAREQDESLAYVLPNHMMLHIAEALPREMQGILACCSPVPLLVKQNLLPLHRIIYAARDRPLEKTVTLASRSTGMHNTEGRSLFESIIDEANRMTNMKSMLRSHLDFSHCAFNEEIGSVLTKRKEKETSEDEGLAIAEKPISETFLQVIGVISAANVGEAGMVNVTESSKTKGAQVANLGAVTNIESALEEWATPFERYAIAVRENEAKKEAQRKAEELAKKERKSNTDEKGNQLFSHHDPVVARAAPSNVSGVDDGTIEMDDPEDGSGKRRKGLAMGEVKKEPNPQQKWREEDILTKSKLKNLQKKRRAAVDISTEVVPAKKRNEERNVKQEQEEGEISDGNEDEKPVVDYSKYDAKALFDQPTTAARAASYNPSRDLGRGGSWRGVGQKKRGGGGHLRARGMSHSFRGAGTRGARGARGRP